MTIMVISITWYNSHDDHNDHNDHRMFPVQFMTQIRFAFSRAPPCTQGGLKLLTAIETHLLQVLEEGAKSASQALKLNAKNASHSVVIVASFAVPIPFFFSHDSA